VSLPKAPFYAGFKDQLRSDPMLGLSPSRKDESNAEGEAHRGAGRLAIRQVEQGTPAAELCRKMGTREQTFYTWRKRFDGSWARAS